MNLYLDASALIALLTEDIHSERAVAQIRATTVVPVVSDWSRAEFASVVARFVRTGVLSKSEAEAVFLTLDGWAANSTERAETRTEDVVAADMMMRRLDLNLRAPDAVHLAIANRLCAVLLTYDTKMAAAAAALGLTVAA